jgi:hypothetical protein
MARKYLKISQMRAATVFDGGFVDSFRDAWSAIEDLDEAFADLEDLALR